MPRTPGQADRSRDGATEARERQRTGRILAADDQPHILEALELLLRPAGFAVDTAKSPAAVRESLASEFYDAVLIDLNYTRDTTSGQEGLDLLSEIVALDSNMPVIVMTAWGNVGLAVEAMRRGARDFIQKPWENERLLAILRTQVELHRALQRTQQLEAEARLHRAEGRPDFIAAAPSMQPVLQTIARIGPSDANVLVTGEHGTGKEVVAQTLHALSPRASMPLVAVNTGALPEGTFESELFGHVKGAFTDARMDRIGRFELADNGTIFLDEIGNVPDSPAGKAAARAGDRRDRTRGLVAHQAHQRSRDLGDQHQRAGGHRRRTVPRRPALPPEHRRNPRACAARAPRGHSALAAHFLKRYAARYRAPVTGFAPPALQAMMQYAWPGNVRELEHTLERAVLMCQSEEIQVSDLGLNVQQRSQGLNLEELSIEEVEGILVRKALQRFHGNVSQAAEALGLSRGALYRRMERYGI